MPADLVKVLDRLVLLDDDDLWRAAQNRFSEENRTRLEALNLKQQSGKLVPAERDSLTLLVGLYDQAVLLRAEAARLLKERGHDISRLLTAR